jgi:hypothetical protein
VLKIIFNNFAMLGKLAGASHVRHERRVTRQRKLKYWKGEALGAWHGILHLHGPRSSMLLSSPVLI